MNTVVKSALFAAVIMFGAIYAIDTLYNRTNSGADYASISPAAGEEETNATFNGMNSRMREVSGDVEAGAQNAQDRVDQAADNAQQSIENNIPDARERAEAEAEINDMAAEAETEIDEAQTEASAEGDIDAVQEEIDLMAEEANEASEEIISETEQAIEDASRTEPAAGNEMNNETDMNSQN